VIKKLYHFMGMTLLTIAASLLLLPRGPTIAADATMIKIQPVGDDKIIGFYIDPPVAKIEKGAVVVWLSGIKDADIQVIFMDGKTCKDVTAPAKSFTMQAKDCYVTSFMSFGETSSLQFVESGTYRYYVATFAGDIKAKGTIVVR
jgi:hypothetical protein